MGNRLSRNACEILPEWRLDAETEGQIAMLLADAFPTDYGGRSFFQQRPHLRLIRRDPDVVGHVAVFLREVRLDGHLKQVLGIGDIATHRAHRGTGIASALLGQALTPPIAGRAEFALLFGRRGLYDRAEFRRAANPIRHVDLTGAESRAITQTSSDFLMVRPLRGTNWPEHAPLDLLGAMF